MEWEYWNGKRIFVSLKSGSFYNGKVIDVEEYKDRVFIVMVDKFGERVIFEVSDIIKIKEERE
jgi:hypothetical protein